MNETNDNPLKDKRYRELRRQYLVKLILAYIAPSLILIVFFIYQYISLAHAGQVQHLLSVAESQSKILDIFLKERVGNLINLIDTSFTVAGHNAEEVKNYYDDLKRNSGSFIDVGFFYGSGIQENYYGPESFLVNRDYSSEEWFKKLLAQKKRYTITDIYPGLRNKPHFTIGVKKIAGSRTHVVKSSLDPEKIYGYLTAAEKSMDVKISIVNREGEYQLPHVSGRAVSRDFFRLNKENSSKGIVKKVKGENGSLFAWCLLTETDWAVIVAPDRPVTLKSIFIEYCNVISASFFILVVLCVVVFFRSKTMVIDEYNKDLVKSQLEQASKLATIGELSAGIAHEIGNPLNIIANEVGMMQDYADPSFKTGMTLQDMEPHFQKILNSVFRCKDITRKLLTFVRSDKIHLKECDINNVLDDLLDGFFEKELSLKNIELIRNYKAGNSKVKIDANQISQVIVNLITNAADAIEKNGTITIGTEMKNNCVSISVTDTGSGISQEKIDKIFIPFFTTKPAGKGTGLGLSVSYGIVENHGGRIKVESIPGKGSIFTVELPSA